ncbi:hypothetical protein V2S66_31320 [Streptomyces sp. V4-01]|uniref:Uncharacterized protein n=1 Tax=Actinacidiphila polyblastidii TaxID=3110430 RepID=A0ABU7PN12_9ACTN|nr:hypothetical protein [Streptomyces sp. V4-01]
MGAFSWLGGKPSSKDNKDSRDRAHRHKRTRPNRAGQRFDDDGRCPAGVYHRGPCRHR